MKRKILITVAVIIVVLVVIALALPALIDANRFKSPLEADLKGLLGRDVAIGNIHLAIWSGGVSVDNVSIADDPAFSKAPFLTARHLTAGVALLPLIFSKKLDVRSFTISQPDVSLIRSASGAWNFSSLGQSGHPPAAKTADTPGSTPSASVPDVTVREFAISGGRVVVRNANGKAREYHDVNLHASNVSYTSQFPFQLSAQTPAGGSVKLDGNAGPVHATDASLTPFHATIDVEHLDLASTGFLDPSAGLGGIVGFRGDISSDRGMMASKGTLSAAKLRLVPGASASTVPVTVLYDTAYDLAKESGALRGGEVHIGKALARLSGSYNTGGSTTTAQMKLDGKNMDVPSLEGLLPALGISLPSGASLTSGALDVNLTLSGPVDKLVIAGPVNLSNAKLEGFDLKGHLGALASFAGLSRGVGKGTEVQTLSGQLRVDSQGTHVSDLNMVVSSLGAITGAGEISATGQLDCKMQAKIQSSNQVVNTVASAISSAVGGRSAGGAIPFKVQGTTSRPIFIPDFSGAARTAKGTGSTAGATAASKAAGILGGILGRKKHQQ